MRYVGAGTTPSSGPTSGIETWKRYVLGRWHGMDLGPFGVRNMRGSDQLSVHAVGRAWDWRYADPGPGRAASDEAISFAIANYETLGIQAVHDYVSARSGAATVPGVGRAGRRKKRATAWATRQQSGCTGRSTPTPRSTGTRSRSC